MLSQTDQLSDAFGPGIVPEFPGWFKPFWEPARYKVAYGGRGSSKSWTFARALIIRGSLEKLNILCARELQISIKDSVYKLLCDQIAELNLSACYEIGKSYIRSWTGTEFIFKGLRHNSEEIKSTEGVDICWIEEAQLVSEASWKLLIPTIRKAGSEIWVSFNPVNETDATFRRFVVTPPDEAIVRKVNYSNNKWFPAELEAERAYMARTDPDSYAHVWEGECMSLSDAQVLNGKWIINAFEPADHWDGPYLGADWGFSKDPTALVKAWVKDRRLYIEHEAYGVGVEIDETPALFSAVPGAQISTIRADNARPETISYMNRQKFNIRAAKKGKGSVEDGVAFLRSFEQIVIHPRCKHTAEEARLWSYKVDRLSGDVLPVLVDANNHLMDALRYALEPLMRAQGEIFIG